MGPQLSATQKRSPEDTVWRQAMRSALAAGKGYHYLKLLWDLKSYYETIDHSLMVKQLDCTKYPVHILMLNIH
eukprot:2865179-Pyramimonas_sp.AAC.1